MNTEIGSWRTRSWRYQLKPGEQESRSFKVYPQAAAEQTETPRISNDSALFAVVLPAYLHILTGKQL